MTDEPTISERVSRLLDEMLGYQNKSAWQDALELLAIQVRDAERERCAGIAESLFTSNCEEERSAFYIAAKIREVKP